MHHVIIHNQDLGELACQREQSVEDLQSELRQENERLKADLKEARNSLTWIESRAADLQFQLNSAYTRLAESQAARRNLEIRLDASPAEQPSAEVAETRTRARWIPKWLRIG